MSNDNYEEEEQLTPTATERALQTARRLWAPVGKALMKAVRWYVGLYRQRPWYVKTLSALASLVIAFILYLGAVDVNFLGLFGKSPSMKTIMNTRPAQASEIYSADGVMIGKFFSENRTPVTYDEVNPVFWHALVDTEDERFYRHFGIDFTAFFAALKDYVMNDEARGASTITQQLAKNLFRVRTEYSTGLLGRVPGLKLLIQKSKEWVTAIKLEWNFTKQEILTMYANTVDFGSNAYGIKTACKTYFGITPAELRPEQAAVLVGMLKATTTYNPRLHPDQSRERRNVVLDNMRTHGHLTRQACDTLKANPIELDYYVEKAYDGQAHYFREAVANNVKEWCRENGVDIYTSGLKIYTTIDMRLQRYAEAAAMNQMRTLQRRFDEHWAGQNPWQDERGRDIPNFIENIAKRTSAYKYYNKLFPEQPDSVWKYLNKPHHVKLFSYDDGPYETEMSTLDSIRYMEHFLHCGFVAIEPDTRHVKAWVGDIDFTTWKYDKVTATRQPGSTFKLFVYTEAMNQGLTPCDRRTDAPLGMKVWSPVYKKEVYWSPSNANGYFTYANMTLKRAFARSINSVAVKLGQEMGIDRVAKTAYRMGIRTKLEETPSLALGAGDVCLEELVNAYATVANDGKTKAPVLVTRILDRDGNEIYHEDEPQEQAISYRTAFFMQQLLQGGLQEPGGTSQGLWRFVRPYADDTDFGGKTGTTNNHSDAWFMGVTPRLVCGAWVGGEYRAIHFRTGALGQGSRAAMPICGAFLEKVLADKHFKKYHAKFAPSHDPNITDEMYKQCSYTYYQPDTTSNDSVVYFPAAVNYPERESTAPLDEPDIPDLPVSIDTKNTEATTAEED